MSGSWWLTDRLNDPFNLIRQAEAREQAEARKAKAKASASAAAAPAIAAVKSVSSAPVVLRYSVLFGEFTFSDSELRTARMDLDGAAYDAVRGTHATRLIRDHVELPTMFLTPAAAVQEFKSVPKKLDSTRSHYENWCSRPMLNNLARTVNDETHANIVLIPRPLVVQYDPIFSILDGVSDPREMLKKLNLIIRCEKTKTLGISAYALLVSLWLQCASSDFDLTETFAPDGCTIEEFTAQHGLGQIDKAVSRAAMLLYNIPVAEVVEFTRVMESDDKQAINELGTQISERCLARLDTPEYMIYLGDKFSRQNWFGVKVLFSTVDPTKVGTDHTEMTAALKARVMGNQTDVSIGDFLELVNPSWRLDPELAKKLPDVKPCTLAFEDGNAAVLHVPGPAPIPKPETTHAVQKLGHEPVNLFKGLDRLKFLNPVLLAEFSAFVERDFRERKATKKDLEKLVKMYTSLKLIVDIITEYAKGAPVYNNGVIAIVYEIRNKAENEEQTPGDPKTINARIMMDIMDRLPLRKYESGKPNHKLDARVERLLASFTTIPKSPSCSPTPRNGSK
jgi:hypothetical protein